MLTAQELLSKEPVQSHDAHEYSRINNEYVKLGEEYTWAKTVIYWHDNTIT